MKVFIVCLIILTIVRHSHQGSRVQSVEIRPNLEKTESKVPVNPLAKQCGGAGKFVQQRNTLCADPTCKSSGDSTDDIIIETDFEASKDFDSLGWRVYRTAEDKETLEYEAEVPDSKVKQGVPHRLHAVVKAIAGRRGKVDVKYEFYCPKDKTVELCIEVKSFEFV